MVVRGPHCFPEYAVQVCLRFLWLFSAHACTCRVVPESSSVTLTVLLSHLTQISVVNTAFENNNVKGKISPVCEDLQVA